MAETSPLAALHHQAEASFLTYGDPSGGPAARVVETFGEIESEYAALRKGCVLLDCPQRGTIRVGGADRADFLNRMVTQELKGLRPFGVRDAFWLSRKGRVEADLRIIELPDQTLIDTDLLVAAAATTSLSGFVFSEQVEIADLSPAWHRLALHGPRALALLRAVSEHADGPPIMDLSPDQACEVRIAGQRVFVDRCDWAGEVGLSLLLETQGVLKVYQQMLERGLDENGHANEPPHAHEPAGPGFRLRQAGWHAFNIARIEAGTPLFNIDFGPSSLPAETGVLARRVSFTKGCYPGQEVVARMRSLGHPKQTLVALRLDADPATTPSQASAPAGSPSLSDSNTPLRDPQPVGGAAVLSVQDAGAVAVGAVTSSARSPMLGDAIVCFAQVRWGSHEPGTKLLVETDAGLLPATVRPSLVFWTRG